MKKYQKIFTIFLLIFLCIPAFVYSAKSTENTGIIYECVDEKGIVGNCDFNDFVSAVNDLIEKIIFLILSFSVVAIGYSGFLFIQSGESAGKREEAKKIFRNIAIGIFFMLSAWMIVKLITGALLKDEVKVFINQIFK